MVPTQFIDDLCDEYDVDFSEEDVFEMLNCCAERCSQKYKFRSFGPMLIGHVLWKIVDLYIDVLDVDKFKLDIDSWDSAIIYDDVRIESKQQLDDIYNKALKCAQSDND